MPGHFPPFIFFLQNIPHQLFLHSPLSAACSFCSFPLPVTLPLFPKSCIYILLRCGSPSQSCSTATLRRRLPSLLLLFAFSPQSGGLSRLIYNASGVGQIFTLTLCAWVHPACREEREGESKNGRISVTELQQTEGEKEGELEGCEHWWAERRRLSSFTHPSSQALQHLLRVFFKNRGQTIRLRNVLERHSVDLTFSKARSLFFLLALKLTLTVHLHLAMSVLKWSKHSKRSSDSIYDVLHLVRFLPCINLLYLASSWLWRDALVLLQWKWNTFPLHLLHTSSWLLTDRQQEAVSHRCVAELPHNHQRAQQDAKIKHCMKELIIYRFDSD